MAKPERDKTIVKSVIKIATDSASDNVIPLIDRITRLRAAIFFGEDVGLDVSHLKILEEGLCASQSSNSPI